METSALRPRGHGVARRLAAGGAAVLGAVTIGLALPATEASAARHNTCATARAAFRAAMNEARFWIGASDRLAAAGDSAGADAAMAEANYYMGQAEGALDDMSAAC
jgi:hypothetical protein